MSLTIPLTLPIPAGPDGVRQIESAVLNDNLEHTGGITLSWNASVNTTIPLGASVSMDGTPYFLLDAYSPSRNSPGSFRYEPQFKHPVARLDRTPFYLQVDDGNGGVEQLGSIPFTGLASTIAMQLAAHFAVYGATDAEFATTFGSWSAEIPETLNAIISVSFDNCSIKAAAARIADAIGCNVFFDWVSRKVKFIAGTTIEGDSYNCFHVLGGTTNMAKATVSGLYAPVTKRLTLNPVDYPGSIIDMRQGSEIKLTKDIIFDDIYPKMELYIADVHERVCWFTDDKGEKVPDQYGTDGSGHQVPLSYKKYSKWYVQLEDEDGVPYSFNPQDQIADKVLSILFQPNFENPESPQQLAGRQFEVVFFPSSKKEWEDDDVCAKADAWQVPAGWFRIVFMAEGSQILPSTSTEGLCPSVGHKVTLVNVRMDDIYKEIAQDRLEDAANDIIAMMMNNVGQYRGTVLTGAPSVGSSYTLDGHSGVVTDISHNLDTGVAEVTVGAWGRKTLTGGMSDKIDSINISGGGGTEVSKGMSKTQFDALSLTGVKFPVKKEIDLLGVNIAAIKEQEDKQFNIWFGNGTPTASTYPANEWTTDELKELHVQDIYYDINRSPASTGGRAWRYLKTNNVYGWTQITDLDTEASLEKIADVASDGILTGGTEKNRLFIDWRCAKDEYVKYTAQTEDYGIATERTAYIAAYQALWEMLNGGEAPEDDDDYITVPAFLSSLTTDTVLVDYDLSPRDYRGAWNDYYEALAALMSATGDETREIAVSKATCFVDHQLPSLPWSQGDFWYRLDSANATTGTMYICRTAREEGDENASISDWQLTTQDWNVSYVDHLVDLSTELEEYLSYLYDTRTNVHVAVGSTAPASPTVGDLWYDNSSNSSLNRYDGSVWSAYSSSEVDASAVKTTLDRIYALKGSMNINFCKTLSNNASANDVCFLRGTYHDRFTNSDIPGALGVYIYGNSHWNHVQDSVAGLMENYGDHIVSAIFGNEALPSGLASYAAGMATWKNFAEMFAQSADPVTGELYAKAGITVHVETITDPNTGETHQQGYVDTTGTFRSADGNVMIDRVDNPYIGGGAKVTMLKFYKDEPVQGENPHPMDDSVITLGCFEAYDYTSGTPVLIFSPFLYVRNGDGRYSLIRGSDISTNKYKINYIDSNDAPQVLDGVGDPDDPDTFETADGKTVEVAGGIITRIT